MGSRSSSPPTWAAPGQRPRSAGSTSTTTSAARSTAATTPSSIADCIRELARRYDVQEVALDPWRAAALGAELEREGLTVFKFLQQDARVVPARQRLYDAVINEKIVLPDLPELAQHAAGAIAKHSRRGWRIDRPNPRVEIDGITALLMALDRLENRPARVELLGWI
jgi:phage terminase large subunit-like protein